jgi:hypothetical protein
MNKHVIKITIDAKAIKYLIQLCLWMKEIIGNFDKAYLSFFSFASLYCFVCKYNQAAYTPIAVDSIWNHGFCIIKVNKSQFS